MPNHFWKRWRTEYVNSLREVHAHTAKKNSGENKSNISVGQVVIVKDDHLPPGALKAGNCGEAYGRS